MTTLEDTLQFVLSHPEDRHAARALIDRAEEEFDVAHLDAVRWVAKQRRESRNVEELRHARQFMSLQYPRRLMLLMHVRGAAGSDHAEGASVVLVAGSRPPKAYPPGKCLDARIWSGDTIIVGARWIIDRGEMLDEDAAEEAAAQKTWHPEDFFT